MWVKLSNNMVASSLKDFNLYVFRNLCGEFKALVKSLIRKAEPLSYADLHSHLLTHECFHNNSIHSLDATASLLPSSLLPQPPLLPTAQPSANLAMSHHSLNFNRNRSHSKGNWCPNNNCYTHQNRGQSVVDWQPNNWQQIKHNSRARQWSGQQHVHYELCFSFSHTTPHCSQFRSNTQQPSTHLAVGNISVATWFPDTDANQHVTSDLPTLTDFAPYLGNDYLHIGDGKGLDISHIGHTTLHSPKCIFTLSNVLHVPHITKQLLSIQKFYHDNYVYFEFHAFNVLLASP